MSTSTPKPLFDPYLIPSVTGTAYTVPVSTIAIIKHMVVHNTDTTPHTVTLYLVESGGTATISNQIWKKTIAGLDLSLIHISEPTRPY